MLLGLVDGWICLVLLFLSSSCMYICWIMQLFSPSPSLLVHTNTQLPPFPLRPDAVSVVPLRGEDGLTMTPAKRCAASSQHETGWREAQRRSKESNHSLAHDY